MTDHELMQQALDALEAMQMYAREEEKGLRICDEAIEALRAQLAQPYKEQADRVAVESNGRLTLNPVTGDVGIGLVQPDPVAAETKERFRIGQDAMTWYDSQGNVTMKIDVSGPLVISSHREFIQPDPPQREWQGLTDEEAEEVAKSVGYNPLVMTVYEYRVAVQRATEAKLKEKNT